MTTTAPTATRSFWTYWAATTTSNMGSAVTTIALPLTAVLVLDAGPFETGLLAAASYLAWIVIGLPAGAIVQRWPLRATQVVTDLVRAAAILSVPLTWWAGHLTLAQLFLVALTLNFAEVLFFSANTTFITSVVPRDQLTSRNSLMSGTHAVTELGGPSLGGLVVQVAGAVPALLLDAVTYVVSAVLLRTLPERRQPGADDPTPVHRRIAEGWRFVTSHPVMAPCTWWACVVNTVCGAQHALFAIYLVRELHAPAAVVGLLLATGGLGALLAAWATPWLVRRFGSARVVLLVGFLGFAGGCSSPWAPATGAGPASPPATSSSPPAWSRAVWSPGPTGRSRAHPSSCPASWAPCASCPGAASRSAACWPARSPKPPGPAPCSWAPPSCCSPPPPSSRPARSGGCGTWRTTSWRTTT